MTSSMSRAAAASSGIDHIVVYVHADLDAVEAHWRKLGFVPTARGYHNVGTTNHLVMLETDYVELLSPNANAPRGALLSYPWRSGLAALALRTSDADADYERCTKLGIAMDPPNDFARPVVLPDGAQDARFRVAMVRPEATPGLIVFFCQHQTPHLVWRPECMNHPNRAAGIRDVKLAVHDASRLAEALGPIVGVPAMQSGRSLEFDLGGARFSLEDAARPAEERAEIVFNVRDGERRADTAVPLPAFPDGFAMDRRLSFSFE